MPQVKAPVPVYVVNIVEYERGWGSKVEDTLYFDNEPEALEYVRNYNSENVDPTVPDWYMMAQYTGKR